MSLFSKDLRISKMPPYLLGEIAEEVLKARLAGKEVVDLSQFNPNLGPPQAAVDALVQASLLPHNHKYSSSKGLLKLREEIARHYSEFYAVDLNPDAEICMTMGTKEGLAHLLFAILSAGDQVFLPTPCYPVHKSAIFFAGGRAVEVSIDKLVLGEFDDILIGGPKVLILNFPHNPTTKVVDREFYEKLVSYAKCNDIYLINDFSYADIYFDDYRPPSLLSVPGAKDVAVEFYSLSKNFNIPGWRVGFCLGNAELVSALRKIKSHLDFGLFQPLQIATIEVLKDRDGKLEETRQIYASRREMFVSGLKEIGWQVEKQPATPFLWAQIPEDYSKMGSQAFSKQLLDESSVALCPGIGFDDEADNHVRIALVENERMLQKAINNISKIFLCLMFFVVPRVSADDCVEAAKLISAGSTLESGSKAEQETYEKALSLCPKLSEAHYNLAVSLSTQGRYGEAVEKFENALSLSEGNALYLLGLAYAQVRSGKLEKAEKIYSQVVDQNPQELQAYEGLAYVYDSLGRRDEAEKIILQAIKQNPNESSLYYNLAVLYEHASKKEQALEFYQKAIEKKSNFTDAHLNLGKLYLLMGKFDQASNSLNKASFLSPKEAAVWLVLAQLEVRRGDFNAAREYLVKAKESGSSDVNVLVQEIIVLERLGEREEAKKLVEESLKKYNGSAEIFSVAGWFALRNSNLEDAEKFLRKAISINKNDAFTHNNLGVLFEMKGLNQSAIDSFRKALELDPNLKEARENLSRLAT